MINFEKESGEQVILVGHSVQSDIEAMGFDKVRYLDTLNYRFKSDQMGKKKKLQDLCS